jgi:hypothetical protein
MPCAVFRCLPMNLTKDDLAAGILRDRAHIGASMADIEPMVIDKSVSSLMNFMTLNCKCSYWSVIYTYWLFVCCIAKYILKFYVI